MKSSTTERNLNGMGHKNSGHLCLMPSLKTKNKKKEEGARDDKVKRKSAATLLCEDYI